MDKESAAYLGFQWGWVVEEGDGPPPQKKIILPQNDKSVCTLPQVLTGRKHGESLSLGTWSLRFSRKTLTKTVQKLSQKNSRSD